MTNPTRPILIVVSLLAAGVFPAYAQSAASNSKWQVDVYGGLSKPSGGADGTAIGQFPAGTTLAGGPATSRAVSSWYFGDGTALFNQAHAALGGGTRIVGLDSVLRGAIANRKDGAAFGVRISRSLTARFAAEFSADYTPVSTGMTNEAADAIGATSASFGPAWTSLLSTGATANRVANSSTQITRGDGSEITVAAALKVRLPGTGKLTPYLTAGGGAILSSGTLPSATLTGTYSFMFAGLFPLNERDVVTVRGQNNKTTPIGLIGGGLEYNIAPRHGIRGDVRVQIGRNSLDTLVSASPSVTTQSPAFVVNTGTNPSIQFSNNPAIVGRQSSLSGPAITDLRTFEESGTRLVTTGSIGYFVRF